MCGRFSETNVLGVFKLTKAAVPLLQERKPGRMVMISSVSGLLVTPFVGAYAGSSSPSRHLRMPIAMNWACWAFRVIGIQIRTGRDPDLGKGPGHQ